jgi:O-acetyl-ADP-ribose deacetylase (regulator of RNase III)
LKVLRWHNLAYFAVSVNHFTGLFILMSERLLINDNLLELVQGDITRVTDLAAIANAANELLLGGGGVDGAIHRAGGPEIMTECRRIGRCPTGSAVITGAGNLSVRKIIHTVGPVWRDGSHQEAELLASCYLESLRLAAANGLDSIAFPSISTGVYGYPLQLAAPVALEVCVNFLAHNDCIKTVRFVLFDLLSFAAYQRALEDMA